MAGQRISGAGRDDGEECREQEAQTEESRHRDGGRRHGGERKEISRKAKDEEGGGIYISRSFFADLLWHVGGDTEKVR